MKKKILETLKFVIGIITLILVVIFQNNIVTVGYIGGIGVALYGICAFLYGDKIGYVLTSLGVSLVSSLSIYKFDILPKFESITFFMCLSMALIVILAFVFEYLSEKEYKKTHSLEIYAEVIDLIKNPNTKKEYYQPLFAYVVDGEELVVGLPGYIDKGIPSLGEKQRIYVNPKDATDVYFEKRKSDKLYMLAVGLFLLIASIIIIITLF